MYFSRGQKHLYHQAIEDEDVELEAGGANEETDEVDDERARATG